MRSFLRALTCTAFALVSCAALAETKPAPAKPAAQAPQAKQEMKMETAQLVGLIKSTIMALQHANQTGNYSVLRDLGTPVFRERFDQAQLTAVFYNLRKRGIDFTPILFLPADLTRKPEMTAGNELHIVGDFQTEPLRIQYDLLFSSNRWRLADQWDGGRRCAPTGHRDGARPCHERARVRKRTAVVRHPVSRAVTASQIDREQCLSSEASEDDKSIAGKVAPDANPFPAQPANARVRP